MELSAKQSQIEVLLVLLGEKEEELEALLLDMREVKHMYKAQMEELLIKIISNEHQEKNSPQANNVHNEDSHRKTEQ
jgi:hypothetical protein